MGVPSRVSLILHSGEDTSVLYPQLARSGDLPQGCQIVTNKKLMLTLCPP